MNWSDEFALLGSRGIALDAGLTSDEIMKIEQENGFRFPADLRSFLMSAVPKGGRFPDWRNLDKRQIAEWMTSPFEGIAFDIENNVFWWDAWGARPAVLSDALKIARAAFDLAPKLLPIHGHRFMPAQPVDAGNPVFSIHQTDIIHYGLDLGLYLRCEFGTISYAEATNGQARHIPFWSDLVELNR